MTSGASDPRPPSEKQIAYLLTLLGYPPWDNNTILHDQIIANVDVQLISSLIDIAKAKHRDKTVLSQLQHLGVKIL